MTRKRKKYQWAAVSKKRKTAISNEAMSSNKIDSITLKPEHTPHKWMKCAKNIAIGLLEMGFTSFFTWMITTFNRGDGPLPLANPKVEVETPQLKPGKNSISVYIPNSLPKGVYQNYAANVTINLHRYSGEIHDPYIYSVMDDEGNSSKIRSKWFHKLMMTHNVSHFSDTYTFVSSVNYTGIGTRHTLVSYLLFRDKDRTASVYVLIMSLGYNLTVDTSKGLMISSNLAEIKAPTMFGYSVVRPMDLLGGTGRVKLNTGKMVTVDVDKINYTSRELLEYFQQTF